MTAADLTFRIVYNTLYVVLCIILLALLLVVPGDFIRQALTITFQKINIIVFAIVYVLGIAIVTFVYATRMYMTSSAIASIPKSWVPVEKGDVNKDVRKVISNNLSRSVAIAWEAHPKILGSETLAVKSASSHEARGEIDGEGQSRKMQRKKSFPFQKLKRTPTAEDEMGIALPPVRPVWGTIEHDGWGSPESPDLPNIQYEAVVRELPNLVEAKAVAQAPIDTNPERITPALDPEAVVLLQRGPTMTMRDYITHLISYGVLLPGEDATNFLDAYEQARFCTRAISNDHFRKLMYHFAELLRHMKPLDPAVLYELESTDGGTYPESDGHIDDDAPRDTTPTTPAKSLSSARSVGGGSTHSVGQSWLQRPTLPDRTSTATPNTWRQYRTAPTTPNQGGGDGDTAVSRSPGSSMRSLNTFAQSRRPYDLNSQPSSASLGSGSQGSVIRLATEEDEGHLPYVLTPTNSV